MHVMVGLGIRFPFDAELSLPVEADSGYSTAIQVIT